MDVRKLALGLVLMTAAWLAPMRAEAHSTGMVGHSGKSGVTCLRCHNRTTREMWINLTVENLDGTPAAQPLLPTSRYILRAVSEFHPGSTGTNNTAYLSGFNMATGTNGQLRTTGVLRVAAGEENFIKINGNEATHRARRSSTNNGGLHSTTWKVEWSPPAFPSGAPRNVPVFVATRRTSNGDVRAFSPVSFGPNTALTTECGQGGTCGMQVSVATTNCVDADGDGFLSPTNCPITDPVQNGSDCDDNNAARNPGAVETCNGIDDNCSGAADEGLATQTWYPDADGDGYGQATATGVPACSATTSGLNSPVTNRSDCNDTNPAINPAAVELCDDVDQNCNGRNADGFMYNGIGVGQLCDRPDDADMCANGIVRCVSGVADCVGDGPREELCDGSNNDDNCDGLPDNAVFTDLGARCSSSAGCDSVRVCTTDGTGTECQETSGFIELCGNNIDDNCDGTVDETTALTWQGLAFGSPCDTVLDADSCATGVVGCENLRPSCLGDVATPEVCADTLDNDCDGTTDETDCTGALQDAGTAMPDAGAVTTDPSDAGSTLPPANGPIPVGGECACTTTFVAPPWSVPWLGVVLLVARRRVSSAR